MYQLTQTSHIKLLSNGALIPEDEGNSDYRAYLEWLDGGNTPEPAAIPALQAACLTRAAFCVALASYPKGAPIFTEAEALAALETFPPKFLPALAGKPLDYQAAAIEAWRETKTVARDAPLFLDLLAFYAGKAGLSTIEADMLGDAIFASAKIGG